MLTSVQKRIYLSPPHMSGNEVNFINEAFMTNWIAPLGPNVDGFEKEIAEYAGVSDAVAVNSGTSAIHLALILLGVEKGDTVFCSSLTFVASANPILYQGAVPVFIDSERDTWNMSPDALERALIEAGLRGKLPKAVIVVNLYGQSAKMKEIITLCNMFGVPVVEDAAESLGSKYYGKKSGSFGEFAIYSFNGNKIITTSGGGMLISNNTEALKKARFFATQARDQAVHYQHSRRGYNYRLSNILAGVGRAQLQVLDERVALRRAVFERYVKELRYVPGLSFMPELEGTHSNRWLTALIVAEEEAGITSEALLESLASENIEARPVWKPLHLQPLFRSSLYYPHNELENVSEDLFRQGICLPSGSNLTEEDQMRIVNCIKRSLSIKV
ncbi:DegT/DnrJ/EryC1/StrS family aminotransferase [Evansella clarkii]|uniref:DegT/DnrJ/EryC1/StrS family aminotransferase n=1 Tax=Evansella clarkii TaxID=79879 RepID=UPI00099865A6|nr:aminotransferase class I/II-fold pyridoxal phosphate-dependent enzyme [Evansella clarkii]